jgi:hypothetical protein
MKAWLKKSSPKVVQNPSIPTCMTKGDVLDVEDNVAERIHW